MKFLLLIILLLPSLSFAQKHVKTDSSYVSVRSFNSQRLQEFKKDSDFQYDRLQEPVKSLWDRFWDWIWWNIGEIMRTKAGKRTVWTTLTILAVAAIVFFVIKVMGMKDGGLFGGNSNGDLPFTTSSEDINNISFEEAIREAIQNGNFRLAIRLLYLQSLKQLSDKGHIQWQINKTNNDYIAEVAGKPWQSLFKKLTYNFEYSWYGEMNIGNEEFQNLNVQFQQFNNQL
jgi:hypothetical protein